MLRINNRRVASGVALSVLSFVNLNAQCRVVSPQNGKDTDETEISTSLPLLHDTPRRHLQIHSDLIGMDVSFTRLSMRRDRSQDPGTGTRRVDCQLFLGNSVPFDRASWVFAGNFAGPRTEVIGRRWIDLPVLTSTSVPAAFELALTFDTPWHYAGVESFAWDLSVFEAEQLGTYAGRIDAYGASATVAQGIQVGLGCQVLGMPAPMTHMLRMSDCAGTLSFGGMVEGLPASAPCWLMLGLANPNATVPGLCSPVYTDLQLALPLGSSDANGFVGEHQYGDRAVGGVFGFAVPNTIPGVTLYSQVHAWDVTSPSAFQLANSDGRSITVPTPDLSRLNRVTRLYNDDGQPLGERAVWIADRNIGFGVVVRFDY